MYIFLICAYMIWSPTTSPNITNTLQQSGRYFKYKSEFIQMYMVRLIYFCLLLYILLPESDFFSSIKSDLQILSLVDDSDHSESLKTKIVKNMWVCNCLCMLNKIWLNRHIKYKNCLKDIRLVLSEDRQDCFFVINNFFHDFDDTLYANRVRGFN